LGGSSSIDYDIVPRSDLITVLVGQFGIISNTNYQTIAGTTIPISSVSGQNTTFTHGEHFVVGIVIGGTTTFLKGMTCLIKSIIALV
jgi:hypothetical protein